MARSDAEKRAANNSLMPGDLVAMQPEWVPLLEKARQRMSPSGLGTPVGMEPGGEIWMRHYMVAKTGYVKWLLHYYRREKGQKSCTLLGCFVTEYLPEDRGVSCKPRPIETHGKTVLINQKVVGELARPVKVLIDADGMPVPIPPEVWNAMGLA